MPPPPECKLPEGVVIVNRDMEIGLCAKTLNTLRYIGIWWRGSVLLVILVTRVF